jgi:glucosylceramidase
MPFQREVQGEEITMPTRRVSLVLVAAAAVACSATPSSPGGPGSSSGAGSASSSGSGASSGGNSGSSSGSSGTGSGSGASSSGSGGSGGTIAGETLPGPTFVTSAQGAYWQTGTTTTVTSGTATLTVNDGTTYQTFSGFGGAFNEKGWSYLQMLSAADRAKALTLLFDWTNGAHLVLGRVPMGANDYAMSRYTEDDTANDYNMTSFSISRDQQYVIPYVQAALAINPDIELWGSPWTPPAWMKENGNSGSSDGNPDDGGNMSSNAQILQAYALYQAKWVQEYAALGITIGAIMPQNEPNYIPTYPSCLWAPALYDQFVAQYLGPEFQSQKIGAQIFLGTMSCQTGCATNDTNTDQDVLNAVTADSAAMKYIQGFGMQWNVIGDIAGLTKFNLPIWQTEHRCGNYPWGGENTILNVGSAPASITYNAKTAQNDFNYAVETFGNIGQWLAAGVTAYSAWNMVLDTVGMSMNNWPQNALLTVDTGSGSLNVTPAYYVFRHFSQYVAAGAARVATGGSSSLVSYAFKNPDGSHAVIMYNGSSSPTQAIVSVGGAMIKLTVPATAFATLKT